MHHARYGDAKSSRIEISKRFRAIPSHRPSSRATHVVDLAVVFRHSRSFAPNLCGLSINLATGRVVCVENSMIHFGMIHELH